MEDDEERGGQARILHGDVKTASFPVRANALMAKNLVFQRRSWKTNACLVMFPALLCLLLFGIQKIVDTLMREPAFTCGCMCVPVSSGDCETRCGVEYSDNVQAVTCPVPSPYKIPAMMQISRRPFQAVNFGGEFPGFPDPSCRTFWSCPYVFVYTGQNRSIADQITNQMLNDELDLGNPLSSLVPASFRRPPLAYFMEPGLPNHFYVLRRDCSNYNGQWIAPCIPTLLLWREDRRIIDKEIYRGYMKGNEHRWINEIPAAYDFQSTSLQKLDVNIFYNATYAGDIRMEFPGILRVARSLNLVTEAFLKTILGSVARLPLLFIKEMPKPETRYVLDFSSLLGPLFYMWVVQLLLPVMLTYLVYEKERNLRMMMKMHGLGDGPYWLITYAYFLALSTLYIICFILFGSLVGLQFFRLNDYSLQFTFYMVYMNLQIALSFFGATLFSRVSTATVCGYLYVFAFGLLGAFLFQNYVEDVHTSRVFIFLLELLPGFSLYRGLYEFAQYALVGGKQGTHGMRWKNIHDRENAFKQVVTIMAVELPIFTILALYLDQVVSSGSGLKRHPLFFLKRYFPRPQENIISRVSEEGEQKPDIAREVQTVQSLRDGNTSLYSVVCDDLKKVYIGKDGGLSKYAVRGLSLAIERGECFGMLGPNGAGKTSSINMMIGFLTPSSGKVYIDGRDISKDMDKLYAVMGVCPQHDLIWELLTGREHLLFYGRLKSLKGSALENAVQASLKSVGLFNGGVGDKKAGTYSGGMKRRLSVAISLIGNPKVVYMDEPSTGLDPASRRTLWNVIRQAKEDRAIVLTTHSMEEAEALCDRIGIFVEGKLQCIGSSNDLKSRYGGSYTFTVTTSPSKELEVVGLVHTWSPRGKRTYNLSGTQKFQLPKEGVELSRVFRDTENAKETLELQAWGLADTTLEDVFIKVMKELKQM
ncbi:ABC transporter A family member 8 isoform X2 [Selaginella moellendorffii]|uniref:ABC transporter A family member 8 isoform X2 n=1 Tax=Selaginella moellendorffii TaxID=88036 RepID=UPI000D1C2323|nr:ABC transporter A family member 8 isoform X2 [Selaginella moellendorffii]|eukprot:XP_024530471.1 ABC transporter A family member 8 isoform X2 [Selaginella moellendorffii]